MNILILANKADIKDYTAIIKKVPNASVLGAVAYIKKGFVQEIKSKWQPHILIIDTAVKSDVDMGVLLKEITYFYPYIKVIVLTDETDSNVYNCFAVIRGQISNTQLGELINKASEGYIAPVISGESQSVAEKVNDNVDNLSTQEPKVREITKPVKVKKPKVKKSFRLDFNPIIVGVIAVVVLLVIIILSLVVKSCSAGTEEQQEAFNTATTVATQENTLIVSFPDPTVSDVVIAPVQQATVNVHPTIPSEEMNTVSVQKNENSDTEKKEESRTDAEKSDNENSQHEHSSAENDDRQEATVIFNNNSYNNEQNKNEVSSVRLSYSQITLTEKEELWLSATVTPSGTGNRLTWESSNESVASVSYGKVSAKRAGTCMITAYCGGKSASCVVVVKEKATQAPATEIVDNVYISPATRTVTSNEIFTVTLTNCDKCTFNISNPALVQVVGGGNNRIQLKAKSVGTVSITATSDDTGKSYTSVITIN